MSYANREQKKTSLSPQDDRGQVSAEVQANQRSEINKSLKEQLGAGFRVDEDGVANNYPIETKMSEAEYPSAKQQRRYIYLGIIASLLIAITTWIAFMVS